MVPAPVAGKTPAPTCTATSNSASKTTSTPMTPSTSTPTTSNTSCLPHSLGSNASPSHLRKFSLHPPSLLTPSSILMTIANGSSPLNATQLANLRTVLISARLQANERLVIRDSNKKNLVDRQMHEKKLAEESARLKELERKKKREEEERKEKEKAQKIEKERLQREHEAQERRRKEEEEFRQIKKKEEELKIKEDEEKRLQAIRLAREAKERMEKEKEKIRLEEEAEAAAQAIAAAATAAAGAKAAAEAKAAREKAHEEAGEEDVEMEQADAVDTKVLDSTTSATAQVPTINIAGSVEPEDDEEVGDQPRPPLRDSKKKKRKRDQVVDSDDEDGRGSSHDSDSDTQPLAQKIRKLDTSSSASGTLGVKKESPTPSPIMLVTSLKDAPSTSDSIVNPYEGLTPIERKLKEDKFVKHSIPIRPPAPGTATAFYLPTQSLVPPKPISITPTPTPKRQADVSGDFSTAKPGTQIAHHTFHTWADAYLRPFGEDDLAFLAPKPDDWAPYFIPPLGKHYTEQWEEEDHDLPPSNTSHYASPLEPPPLARIKLDALNEDALGSEVVTLGPLSERLVAALAFTGGGRGENEDDGPSRTNGMTHPNGTGSDLTAQLVDPGAQTRPLDAVELEERIKRELRFIGLLPEDEVDWSCREDDEISSALRSCQRQLHRQTMVNEARKVVLSGIVKDRMAYQDYETTRDAQERVIENGWLKRQKTQVKKKGKAARDRNRNKKDKEVEEDVEGLEAAGKQPLSLSLLQAVDRRHVLVESFRPFFEEERAGRFWGIPTRSVYEGLVEETEEGGLKGELVE